MTTTKHGFKPPTRITSTTSNKPKPGNGAIAANCRLHTTDRSVRARHDPTRSQPDLNEPRHVAAQTMAEQTTARAWNLEPNSPEPPRPTLNQRLPANGRSRNADARPRKAPNQQSPPQPSRSPKSAHLSPSSSQGGLQQGTGPARPSSSDNRAIRRNPRPNVVRSCQAPPPLIGRPRVSREGMG
jgi:hypothetical protein